MKPIFEPGAPVAAGTIPLSVPHFAGREAEYLQECMASGFVSSVGPFVDRFENDFARYAGTKRAVAVTCGTAALHLALLVGGVKADDEVLISDLTFVAPANAIRYANALPVFIGAEPEYWQIDPEAVRGFFTEKCVRNSGGLFNKHTGRRISALVAVHILGHPVDLEALAKVCSEFGVILIEDCAEALGTEYRGKKVGSVGVAAGFSFNGNKIVTCGGGGMLVARDPALLDRAKYLSTQAKDDPLEYIHHAVGFNYRLTSLQAAVGCAQLEQLDGFIKRRREIGKRYEEAFAEVPGLNFMKEAPWAFSTYWLSTVRVDAKACGMDSRAVLKRLADSGIQSRPLWQPLHQSPAFAGCESYRCEFDRELHGEALSLPSSANLTNADQERVIFTLLKLTGHGS